jgi:hypothetical protein
MNTSAFLLLVGWVVLYLRISVQTARQHGPAAAPAVSRLPASPCYRAGASRLAERRVACRSDMASGRFPAGTGHRADDIRARRDGHGGRGGGELAQKAPRRVTCYRVGIRMDNPPDRASLAGPGRGGRMT